MNGDKFIKIFLGIIIGILLVGPFLALIAEDRKQEKERNTQDKTVILLSNQGDTIQVFENVAIRHYGTTLQITNGDQKIKITNGTYIIYKNPNTEECVEN